MEFLKSKKSIGIIALAVCLIVIFVVAVAAGGKKEKEPVKTSVTENSTGKESKESATTDTKTDKETDKETDTEQETESETEQPAKQTTEAPQETMTEQAAEVLTEEVTEQMTEILSEPVTEPFTEQQTQAAVYTPMIKNQGEYLVAIDPGHQAQGNFEKEPVGPGASQTKYKVAGGASGVASGLAEYQLTLAVSFKLEQVLLERGYQVLMIRRTNDVDISNAGRAQMANEAGADVFVRIHADSEESGSATGMTALCQTAGNPYNASLYTYSRSLCENILNGMSNATGARVRGVMETDTMSGINWATVPVCIIEMGFMSNAEEDLRMSTEEYQEQLARGMADGIEAYFAGLSS